MTGRTVPITWDNESSWDGVNASYWRLKSDQQAIPPFTFSGRMRLREIMNPPVFDRGPAKGQTAWYKPALNFHPLYPSNDRNIVLGFGARDRPHWVGISAEMRDVRPEQPYGVRTGYATKVRNVAPDPMDGQWHSFRCEVLSYSHYQLWWDGQLLADVVEKEPATIDPGPVSVGLRLDFCDIDLADMELTQMGTLYPTRYGTRLVTLSELRSEHHADKMHPEFARRLFGWLEAQGGKVGIGGSWRADGTQPDEEGYAPEGRSFHQFQQFGPNRYFAAVDLVCRNGTKVHRAPRWDEVPVQGSADANFWGVHCNVSNESWHMQPVINHIPGYDGLDGWLSWVNAGRPDLEIGYGLKDLDMKLTTPTRIYDSRESGQLKDGQIVTVKVPGAPVSAAFVNLTVTGASRAGYVTAWSGNTPLPNVSNLNYQTFEAVCNTSWVPLTATNTFSVFVQSGCHLIVDLQAIA